jgi:hypothetical protein
MTKVTTRKSPSTRLTDTQLILLSRAAQREDGAASLPDGLTEKTALKLVATLIRKALVRPSASLKEGGEHLRVIRMPARERRAVFDDIARGP